MKAAAAILSLTLVAGLAFATTDELSEPERALLAPVLSVWSTLDAPTRQRLQAQAEDWLQRSPTARAALQARVVQWNDLPPESRTRRRTAFAAWSALDAAEQTQVQAAAQRYASLAPAQQRALREQFAALEADARAGWWMGPGLGADFGGLRALFAFAPEAERPALRAALRGLDAAARRDLATLTQRLSDGGRERLRRDLLATPPEQRAALIRARLAQ